MWQDITITIAEAIQQSAHLTCYFSSKPYHFIVTRKKNPPFPYCDGISLWDHDNHPSPIAVSFFPWDITQEENLWKFSMSVIKEGRKEYFRYPIDIHENLIPNILVFLSNYQFPFLKEIRESSIQLLQKRRHKKCMTYLLDKVMDPLRVQKYLNRGWTIQEWEANYRAITV